MTVWSIGSPSGFTGRLFHTITCAQSRRDSHTANHIMCGVWNRQWGDPLGDKPGHQASRYLPWWKWHQKQNMTWDFIISTSGIQGDFWYINHGCRQDNSWKNQLVTNFFHLHYKILSNALGLNSTFLNALTGKCKHLMPNTHRGWTGNCSNNQKNFWKNMQILIQSCHSVKIDLGERPPILWFRSSTIPLDLALNVCPR